MVARADHVLLASATMPASIVVGIPAAHAFRDLWRRTWPPLEVGWIRRLGRRLGHLPADFSMSSLTTRLPFLLPMACVGRAAAES